MNAASILVVDDEKEIADLIAIHLQSEGYQVFMAGSGEQALQVLREHDVQLIILDIMMPGMDGLEMCRRVREVRNTPILMLSARAEDVDKILGLKTGADDYMAKPFNPLELVARVRAQLRRYLSLNPDRAWRDSEDILRAGGLEINRAKRTITVGERRANLTPTEYEILLLLAGHPGRVFSSEEIYERVWQERYLHSNNTVMVHIRKIREKIEDDPRHPTLVTTVWGVGYRLEA
ncbi:MAG TPA: response regulator transcription factor [Bacillota bacterium]|jgi:DNA-binding response OmpR family regulator